mgnify:CR=1 FL=1
MLEFHAFAVLVIGAVAFTLFASERVPIQLSSLLLLIALALLFQIFPLRGEDPLTGTDMFFGFGHPALAGVAGLMVLGHSLVATGALDPLTRVLGRLWSRNEWLASLAVLAASMGLSVFINDTPVVVLMLPVLMNAALRANISPARTLMPMNFAVLIGGTATTIGTSTNLLVVSIAEDLGVDPFRVFEFAPLVLTAAVPALLYLWLIAPRLLMRGRTTEVDRQSARLYEAAMLVVPGSYADGREVAELSRRMPPTVRALRLIRGRSSWSLLDSTRIRCLPGDVLLVQGSPADLKELEAAVGLRFTYVQSGELERNKGQQLAEIAITGSSRWVGSTVRAFRLKDRYGVALLGLHRPAALESMLMGESAEEPADVPLRAGDVLLVQGPHERIEALSQDPTLLMLDGRLDLPHSHKAGIALAAMAGSIALAAFGILPIAISVAFGVAVLLATGAIGLGGVGRALKTDVIFLIAASLALGRAFTATGLDDRFAALVLDLVSGASPAVVVATIMAMMSLVTNFVSNSAAAAIGTPIAVSVAQQLGLPPEPFVLAVLFGCNLSYATPMAYQTNLLIMSAANYRFADFVRVGVPLVLLMLATLTFGLCRRYGLA